MSSLTIPEMSKEIEQYLIDHGWKGEGSVPVSLLEAMMLLVTEAVEAVEAWRQWGTSDVTIMNGKPEGLGSEFADILIRLIDSAERFGIDLDFEYRRKMDYNHTRPWRHNKKL